MAINVGATVFVEDMRDNTIVAAAASDKCILCEFLFVLEGGRLEEELAYTREKLGVGSGTTSEIVIQTPKIGNSILTTDSLQLHLQALLKVTQIRVEMYEM